MSLIPIKLLKNKANRNKLLKIKDETPEIDKNDYIESRINTNVRAKNLLAIEDASEIAKYYLHKKGVFEQIAKDIQKESKKKFKFMFRKTTALAKTKLSGLTARSGVDYMLMEHSYPDGSGHYGMARLDHDKFRHGWGNGALGINRPDHSGAGLFGSAPAHAAPF